MKYFNQNDAFIVKVEKDDILAFNKEEPANLPTGRDVVFGFTKGSGRMIRVEPVHIRKAGTAWERLADKALAFGQEIVHG